MYKVLVLAYYFPPMGLSGVQRTLKFLKYMGQHNWKPTVITTGKTAYYAHDSSLLKEAEEADIEIIRTEAFDPNSMLASIGTVTMPREYIRKTLSLISKTIFIPDNKISWAKKAYKKACEICEKENFDVIYVSIPPFSPFTYATKLRDKFNIPLVVDYRDLWFGNQFAFNPTPYHNYKHKKLEEAALRKADKITVVNRKVKEKLITTYPFLTFDRVVIIPHGYDSADFEKVEFEKPKRHFINVTYSGIFYENITPVYLIAAFKELLNERPDIAEKFRFNIVGHFRKRYKKLVEKMHLNEYFNDIGYVDHSEALRRIMQADVLWVMLANSKGMEAVTPGKIFEYFGARKPILATIPDGATKLSAEEYGASFITDPENVDGIKNALIEIHNLYQKNKLPQPNEEFVLRHDRKYLTEELTKQFQFFLRDEL